MFKGAVENKQQHVGTFEAMDGRRFTKADIEDPDRPGFLRMDLVPIDPVIWAAGAFFGLSTPTGRPMAYVQVKPDPQQPLTEQAPVTLRQEFDAAQREYDVITAERQQVVDELGRAEAGIQDTAELAYTRRIGEDEARRKIAEFEAARLSLEERLRELDHFRLPPACARLSEAQRRLAWWVDDERLRRQEKAKT